MSALRNTGLHFGFIRWFIPLVIFLVVLFMLCLVYGNSSTYSTDMISVGTASKKFWLLTVNMTKGTDPEDGASGYIVYGYGVFGVCGWGSAVSVLGEDAALCFGKPGWKLNVTAGDFEFPSVVTESLGTASLFLVIPIALSAVFLIIQALTYKLKYNDVPPRFNWYTARKAHLQEYTTTVGYRCSSLMRSWFFTFPLFFFFTFIPSLIVIIICGMGKYQLSRDKKTDITAKLGSGWTMLVAAVLLQLIGLIVVHSIKPWRKKEESMPRATTASKNDA